MKFTEFAQIIEKKIRQDLRLEVLTGAAIPLSESLDHPNMSFLLGQIERLSFNHSKGLQGYQKFQKPPPPRPDHKLGLAQKRSLEFLSRFAPHLMANFQKKDLKTAFRKAVLKTHPDCRGCPQDFQKVQEAYQQLNQVFN